MPEIKDTEIKEEVKKPAAKRKPAAKKTDTVQPTAEVKKEKRTYTTVTDNEDLWRLSKRIGVSVTTMINLNKIDNPNKLPAGTVLVLE